MSKRIEGAATALSHGGRAWVPTRRQLMLTALAGLGGIVLTGCGEQLPTYRYRLTVEVETPAGLRTGSSVIEVRTARGGGFPGPEAGGIASSVRGEAVAVNLGAHGTLFALLATRDNAISAAGIAPSVLLPQLVDRRGTPEAWGENLRALKEVRGAAPVPRDQYPLMVRFGNAADSRSVEEVDPDELESALGRGVRLRRITVEITDDEVTQGIANRLPWLGPHPEPRLDPDFRVGANPNLPQSLTHGHFRRGT